MKKNRTTLYKLGNNQLLTWRATVEDSVLTIEHGSQTETDTYPSHEDARKEYNRRIAVKMTKQGYTQKIPTTRVDLPMLAVPYSPSRTPLSVYVQPKLDGIRCIGTSTTMITRRRESIACLPHIQEAISSLPPEIALDGELYCHGKNFQDHLSLIKRDELHKDYLSISYHVFDIQTEGPYSQRLIQLSDVVRALNSPYIVQIKTDLIHKSEIHEYLNQYPDYEGLIVRDPDGLYERDKRSNTLQKLKKWEDEEFEIIDIKAAEQGREKGAAILVCRTNLIACYPPPVPFDVRPKGSIDLRRNIYNNRHKYIGLYTRVTYCGKTIDGKPKQATAEGYFGAKP